VLPGHQLTGPSEEEEDCLTRMLTSSRSLSVESAHWVDMQLRLIHHSRVVTGFPTGHNTLRRHLFVLGLLDSPVCRGVVWRRRPWLMFFVNVDMCIWAPPFWSQETSRA
jgi:hypothetical protein